MFYRNMDLFQLQKEWNLLHQVCCNGNVEMIQWLLETIPELKARDTLNKKSHVRKSRMHIVAITANFFLLL